MKTKATGAEVLVAAPVSLIERILLKYTNAILEEMKELHTKHRYLEIRHSQTKARLQVVRESFTEKQWQSFLLKRPQAIEWFNEDNVPQEPTL